MNDEKIISFPHLGEYYVAINYFVSKLVDIKIQNSPAITKRTIELGTKYSPDFVCIPFKYNLGNYIESLENGANILLQAGGGCRYGYYAEVQKKILEDMGYKFDFYTLTNSDSIGLYYLYGVFKDINTKLSFFRFIKYLLITLLMINYLDNIDDFIRRNIGFEVNKGEFKSLKKKMQKDFGSVSSMTKLTFLYFKYKRKFKKIKVYKSSDRLKIGIIGELYTSMEPFSSYFLEEELAKMNIEVKRFTNVTYLLVKKRFQKRKMLRYARKYMKNAIGADGLDNVYRALKLSNDGYDGIIHIKPSYCTPEVSAIPIIDRVCKDKNMPIIYFSFDNQTSMEGIKTRLEAFYDMLKMRKDNNND